jgi:hypothetical protein
MTQSERFLEAVEAFLTRSGMTATAFGTAALNDPSFVPNLRNGRSPRLALVDKVHAFIQAHDSPPQVPDQGEGENNQHEDGGAPADPVQPHEVSSC